MYHIVHKVNLIVHPNGPDEVANLIYFPFFITKFYDCSSLRYFSFRLSNVASICPKTPIVLQHPFRFPKLNCLTPSFLLQYKARTGKHLSISAFPFFSINSHATGCGTRCSVPQQLSRFVFSSQQVVLAHFEQRKIIHSTRISRVVQTMP